jgi:two-component system nitrate/nitrite response regulator NarL
MREAPVADVSMANHAPAAPLRRISLFGPPSLYQDALKCLIENRVSQSAVTHVVDEEALLKSEADLILLHVDLERVGDVHLAALAATLKKLAPRPVLLISGGMQPVVLQRLLREGVAGIVTKSSPCEVLLNAIDSVSSGKVWLQRDLLAETFGESSHVRRACSEEHRITQLTQREREIVAVASGGLTNRQVANKLVISEATARHHLSSIFAKLGLANRGELIIFAYRHGLADEADRLRLC